MSNISRRHTRAEVVSTHDGSSELLAEVSNGVVERIPVISHGESVGFSLEEFEALAGPVQDFVYAVYDATGSTKHNHKGE